MNPESSYAVLLSRRFSHWRIELFLWRSIENGKKRQRFEEWLKRLAYVTFLFHFFFACPRPMCLGLCGPKAMSTTQRLGPKVYYSPRRYMFIFVELTEQLSQVPLLEQFLNLSQKAENRSRTYCSNVVLTLSRISTFKLSFFLLMIKYLTLRLLRKMRFQKSSPISIRCTP